MANLAITVIGPSAYAIEVTDGRNRTRHRVTVPAELRADLGIDNLGIDNLGIDNLGIDNLGIDNLDEQRLVRETFAFLLEREPAGAILREFSLDVVSRYFPDYLEEIRRRLSGPSG